MRSQRNLINNISVIAEILLTLIVGSILYKVVLKTLFTSDFLLVQFDHEKGNAIESAVTQGVQILLHFSIVLAIAFLLIHFIHRMKLSDVGITRNKHSFLHLLGYGIVLFCVSALPWKTIVLINQLAPFGEGLHGWDDINRAGWSWEILLLIAARAVILPPLMEEPMARGYMFHRLQLAYGAGGAMILSAIIFTFSHGHFSSSDPVILAD